MSDTLKGKVALVTGGSRGLGVAIAHALARQGASVAITYVNAQQAAEAVVADLEAWGARAIAIRCDQANVAAAPGLMEDVVSSMGGLDILVNNAAIGLQGLPIDHPDYDAEAMDRQWTINVAGVVANIRAASKHLSDHGRIISISSGLSRRVGWPGAADYAGTKAAITGFSKGVARDLAPRNITVNMVEAGIMLTDMTLALAGEGVPPELFGLMALPRPAELDEVAAAAAFLASPAASYITGSIIEANGGYFA